MTVPAGRSALSPIAPTPAHQYASGSPERATTDAALAEVRTAAYDVPNQIGAREARTGHTVPIVTPHDHATQVGQVHHASAADVTAAIDAARSASRWS